MKRFFGLYLIYISYLLILGQGCSAIDGVDHVVSVPLPSFTNAPTVSLKDVPEITFSKAPEKLETVIPSPILVKSPIKTSLEKRKNLPLKTKPIKSVQRPIPPIKKSFEINVEDLVDLDLLEGELLEQGQVSQKENGSKDDNVELSLRTGIEHYGFDSPELSTVASWEASLGSMLENKLAELKVIEEAQLVAESKVEEQSKPLRQDTVTNIQAASEKSQNAYDPSDPKMLAMFEQPQVDLDELVKNKQEQEEVKRNENADPVYIDYSEGLKGPQTGLARVAAAPVSSAVSQVIKREMGPVNKDVNFEKALAAMNDAKSRTQPARREEKETHGRNTLELYALEASLNNGFKGDVTNFNFVPSYDINETVEDFGEGHISLDYSLQNSTGVLRGTLLKNYYIRTTFEIPLGSEYSKFEIPMITQESIVDYLDQNNLEGYGGYYLADLGEYLEDVELERGSSDYKNTYEHRLLLDDNFKKVKEGGAFRYVLFIGVAPGNVTVRYLGINGQETSKITFVAPDELLYDFSQLERPLELSLQTKLQNTLGRKATPLNVDPSKFINFLSGEKARQVGPGEYNLKTPWKVKGARSYFELGYLNDSIFVGVDGDKALELPSREFIGETLQAFNMSGLNKECLLQINFARNVRDLKILGESARGPAVFDMAYLDDDGVFSAELSPISKKLFLLGNEDGVFNIKVTYENGNEDYLRTYCSTSTYLLEQL